MSIEAILESIEKSPYRCDIKYLDYVTNDVLPTLYNNTDCYIFPSLYEGFGIPLLEAMEYHIPIASSNQASLPEVGGDACFYFNPYDVKNTVEVLNKILTKESFNQVIIEKQRQRLEFFNWEKLGLTFSRLYRS